MLTIERISKFYEDVQKLGLKRPVAVIAKTTEFSKGQVSDYLNRKKEPSENFLRVFYEKFSESIQNVPRETPPEQIVLSGAHVTLQDHINLLKEQNDFLKKELNSKMALALEMITGFGLQTQAREETALRSLARLEKKPNETLIKESDKLAVERQKELIGKGKQQGAHT